MKQILTFVLLMIVFCGALCFAAKVNPMYSDYRFYGSTEVRLLYVGEHGTLYKMPSAAGSTNEVLAFDGNGNVVSVAPSSIVTKTLDEIMAAGQSTGYKAYLTGGAKISTGEFTTGIISPVFSVSTTSTTISNNLVYSGTINTPSSITGGIFYGSGAGLTDILTTSEVTVSGETSGKAKGDRLLFKNANVTRTGNTIEIEVTGATASDTLNDVASRGESTNIKLYLTGGVKVSNIEATTSIISPVFSVSANSTTVTNNLVTSVIISNEISTDTIEATNGIFDNAIMSIAEILELNAERIEANEIVTDSIEVNGNVAAVGITLTSNAILQDVFADDINANIVTANTFHKVFSGYSEEVSRNLIPTPSAGTTIDFLDDVINTPVFKTSDGKTYKYEYSEVTIPSPYIDATQSSSTDFTTAAWTKTGSGITATEDTWICTNAAGAKNYYIATTQSNKEIRAELNVTSVTTTISMFGLVHVVPGSYGYPLVNIIHTNAALYLQYWSIAGVNTEASLATLVVGNRYYVRATIENYTDIGGGYHTATINVWVNLTGDFSGPPTNTYSTRTPDASAWYNFVAGYTGWASNSIENYVAYDYTPNTPVINHNVLSNLGLPYDDHIQYARVDGYRKFTGDVTSDRTYIGKQIATPDKPLTGYSKLYPKADGKWYTITSDTGETAIGTGGGTSLGTSEVFLEGTQGVQVKGNAIEFRNAGVSRVGNTIFVDCPKGGSSAPSTDTLNDIMARGQSTNYQAFITGGVKTSNVALTGTINTPSSITAGLIYGNAENAVKTHNSTSNINGDSPYYHSDLSNHNKVKYNSFPSMNITAGLSVSDITASNDITANEIRGSGQYLTGVLHSESDTLNSVVSRGESTATKLYLTGGVSVSDISASGTISTGSSITAGLFYGNGENVTKTHNSLSSIEGNGNYHLSLAERNKVEANSFPELSITNGLTVSDITAGNDVTANIYHGSGSQLTGVVHSEADTFSLVTNRGESTISKIYVTGGISTSTIEASGAIRTNSSITAGSYFYGDASKMQGIPSSEITIDGDTGRETGRILYFENGLVTKDGNTVEIAIQAGASTDNLNDILGRGNSSATPIYITSASKIASISGSGTINYSGSITTGSKFYGDGAELTNVVHAEADTLQTITDRGATTTNSITVDAIHGDGQYLTGVVHLEVDTLSSITARGESTSAQIFVTGGIKTSTIIASGSVNATNSITTGAKYYGDGSELTGVLHSYSETSNFSDITSRGESTASKIYVTGGIETSNIEMTGTVSTPSSITAGIFYGDGSHLTGVVSTSEITVAGTDGKANKGAIIDFTNGTANRIGNTIEISITSTPETDTLDTVMARGQSTNYKGYFTGGIETSSVIASGAITSDTIHADGQYLTNVLHSYTETSNLNDVVSRGESTATKIYLTGGISTSNISMTGTISTPSSVTAGIYYGDGSHLTGVVSTSEITIAGTDGKANKGSIVKFTNGTANRVGNTIEVAITIPAESDTLDTVTGRGNSTTNAISVGGVNASGSITAGLYYGDGTNLTGVLHSYSETSNLDNVLARGNSSATPIYITAASEIISISGSGTVNYTGSITSGTNVYATKFIGDGSLLTNLPAQEHNDTTGKQGGASGEYYHISETDFNKVNANSFPALNVTGGLTAQSTGNFTSSITTGAIIYSANGIKSTGAIDSTSSAYFGESVTTGAKFYGDGSALTNLPVQNLTFAGSDGVAKTGTKAKFKNGTVAQSGGAGTTVEITMSQSQDFIIIEDYIALKEVSRDTISTPSTGEIRLFNDDYTHKLCYKNWLSDVYVYTSTLSVLPTGYENFTTWTQDITNATVTATTFEISTTTTIVESIETPAKTTGTNEVSFLVVYDNSKPYANFKLCNNDVSSIGALVYISGSTSLIFYAAGGATNLTLTTMSDKSHCWVKITYNKTNQRVYARISTTTESALSSASIVGKTTHSSVADITKIFISNNEKTPASTTSPVGHVKKY